MDDQRLDVVRMLTGSLRRMSSVFRYSSIPVNRRENVAEHTFYCSLYAFLLAQQIKKDNPGIVIDMALLLEHALLHDLDEALTGDFLRSVKYGHPDLKKALDELSTILVGRLSKELGYGIQDHWSQVSKSRLEGEILALSDLLCVVAYVYEERCSGNHHTDFIFREVREYLMGKFHEYPSKPETVCLIPYLSNILDFLTWVVESNGPVFSSKDKL